MQVKARDLKTKCLLVSKIGKMKKDYFERRTRKLSIEFFHNFDQQPEGSERQCLKVNFVMNLKR